MAVATLHIEEGSLMKGLDGLAGLLFEGDRDKRLDARRRSVIVPGEGEDESLVPDDLAIDAAEPVFALLCGLDHRTVGAADAEIDFRFGASEVRGPHPALHVFWLGPERKQHRSGRVEGARDEEFVLGESRTHLRFSLLLSSAM